MFIIPFGRSTSDLNGRQRNQFMWLAFLTFKQKIHNEMKWNETERFMRWNKSIALISLMLCIVLELSAQIWKLKLKMLMHGIVGADGENQAIGRILKQKHL